MTTGRICGVVAVSFVFAAAAFGQPFVNYETSHVHPIDVSPDGNTLAVCNTPDNRIQLFDISTGVPVRPSFRTDHVPVGVEPVSVRFLTNTEVWVVNHLSDSISVVNLLTGTVAQTIDTLDEPADVVFAGLAPLKAFVTCSSVDTVQVFDTTNPLGGPIVNIPIEGEDPRALAVNPSGTRVFAAIFESGNKSTVLPGGFLPAGAVEPVNDTTNSPYLFISNPPPNPPPNSGVGFSPPMGALPAPPEVSHIVKKNGLGQWMDDNGGDWTILVTGGPVAGSDRMLGWDIIDNDVAVIDAAPPFTVTYAEGMMNTCMAIGFNPAAAQVTVVGIDGTNEIRFEPNITGTFIRDNLARFTDGLPGAVTVSDMNVTHLDAAQGGPGLAYVDGDVPQADRDKSIGDPRGIVWMSTGKGYVSGMGSNNVIPLVNASTRTSVGATIEVGEGPTGLALNLAETRLYVLNKFSGTISTIDTATDTVISTVPFFDPTPPVIKIGRKHLYDTHKTSGLGHIACGSCHIDGKMDRLAWDLGDPTGAMDAVTLSTHNMGMGLTFLEPVSAALATVPWEDSHPMKGPMTTQTLQDIIGKEPFHWRGDRQGIESFNPAFVGLNGDDVMLTTAEMQEFENFLATIWIPPNPHRNLDNSLPASVPLRGQFATGDFVKPKGAPLDPGDPRRGLRMYMGTEPGAGDALGHFDGGFNCVTCHTLPIGNGADSVLRPDNSGYDPIPVGPLGNHHIGMNSTDLSTNIAIKIPQLRVGLDKIGFAKTQLRSRAGFGYFHDGAVDTLAEFLSPPTFDMASDQDISDMVALMFCFSGSDFGNPPQNPPTLFDANLLDGFTPVQFVSEPLSFQTSKDTHAAVGKQVTINTPLASLTLINQFIDLADAGVVDLVVKGVRGGERRGWMHVSGSSAGTPIFGADGLGEMPTLNTLIASAGVGSELTFTVVHAGSGTRAGIDRDGDGFFDFDEILAGTDPADAASVPAVPLTAPWQAFLVTCLVALACWKISRRIARGGVS